MAATAAARAYSTAMTTFSALMLVMMLSSMIVKLLNIDLRLPAGGRARMWQAGRPNKAMQRGQSFQLQLVEGSRGTFRIAHDVNLPRLSSEPSEWRSCSVARAAQHAADDWSASCFCLLVLSCL